MDHYPFNQVNPFPILSSVRSKDTYCDATIVCEGKSFKVHRVILSAYSRVLGELFDTASDAGIQHMLVHPVIVLPGVKNKLFEAILNYIYNGQVNVASSDLQIFIETAKYLKINNLENIKSPINNIFCSDKLKTV